MIFPRSVWFLLITSTLTGCLGLLEIWETLPKTETIRSADWTFDGTKSMSFTTSILLWDFWRLWASLSGSPDRSETQEIFPRTETIRSHSSRAGKPSNLSPVSREMISDSVELWETAVCFLHIQNAQCSSRSGFWISKISCKVRVLKQSQSALLSSVSHMTILFVVTCVMNIWNQSIQAFVTSFGPFCDGSCELIYWP